MELGFSFFVDFLRRKVCFLPGSFPYLPRLSRFSVSFVTHRKVLLTRKNSLVYSLVISLVFLRNTLVFTRRHPRARIYSLTTSAEIVFNLSCKIRRGTAPLTLRYQLALMDRDFLCGKTSINTEKDLRKH